MTKATYSTLSAIVNEMTEATRTEYDSYAFAAGYLGTMVASLIAELPKHKQKEMILQLQATTLKYVK